MLGLLLTSWSPWIFAFCVALWVFLLFAFDLRIFFPLFSPPLLSSGHFSFHSFSIIFCNSLALWTFLLIFSLAVNPVLYIISNIIFITSISALICPSLRLASYSQITISRGEECVLQDNSQRTKWKVISPTGNEAMVPSVCFTVPPPNQEAIDTASRWATNILNIFVDSTVLIIYFFYSWFSLSL